MTASEITPCFIELPHRGLIKIGGADAFKFLQNIVTNDLTKTMPLHSCLLNAQGKFLHDFFVFKIGDEYWLDCEGGERAQDLKTALLFIACAPKLLLNWSNSILSMLPCPTTGEASTNRNGPKKNSTFGIDGVSRITSPMAVAMLKSINRHWPNLILKTRSITIKVAISVRN